LKELEDTIQSALDFKYLEPAVYSFRGSSLPYCSVRDVLTECRKVSETLPNREITLKNRFIMDQGSLIHELVQNILGSQGRIFGNWFCKTCRLTVATHRTGPVHCDKCKTQARYEEIRVQHPSGFSGSVDALIPTGNGQFFLADLKTTDKSKFSKMEVPLSYKAQVNAYRYCLTHAPYNLPIVGCAIVYIARDDIFKYKVMPLSDEDMSDETFEGYVRSKQESETALVTGEVSKLRGSCKDRSDSPYCPYGALCFSPMRDKILDDEYAKAMKIDKTDKTLV